MSREDASEQSSPPRESSTAAEAREGDAGPSAADEFPVATVRDTTSVTRHGTHFWWLTFAAVVVAFTLVLLSTETGGLEITVRFDEGHGIKPGDTLRHKDIAIGRVTAAELTPSLDGVTVKLIVNEAATSVAREGSRFWIERPRVSLQRVSGLETVVGPKYVEVDPGPPDAAPATSFQGLETPPTMSGRASTTITIRFKQGNGLQLGDVLKFRGIDVGEVTSVRLSGDLSGVVVTVRLVEGAARLTRAGSQFWVERPRVRLTEVRGLDTLVGGRYLAVVPGPEEARLLRSFTGLESPPTLLERSEGGLEIILEGLERSGLSLGSPLTYRGISIGQVTSMGLSSDSTRVEARAYIQPHYRRLVHPASRFWSISGIEVEMGLTGVKLDMESLSTVAAGGVALLRPQKATGIVRAYHPAAPIPKSRQNKTVVRRLQTGKGMVESVHPANRPIDHPERRRATGTAVDGSRGARGRALAPVTEAAPDALARAIAYLMHTLPCNLSLSKACIG